MSKTWYPVINYQTCIECGACFNKCQRGVFKLEGARPVVVYPDGCMQGCHGCGNLCPNGSIEYVGDNTGWVAPGKKNVADEPCCGADTKKDSGCCGGSSC